MNNAIEMGRNIVYQEERIKSKSYTLFSLIAEVLRTNGAIEKRHFSDWKTFRFVDDVNFEPINVTFASKGKKDQDKVSEVRMDIQGFGSLKVIRNVKKGGETFKSFEKGAGSLLYGRSNLYDYEKYVYAIEKIKRQLQLSRTLHPVDPSSKPNVSTMCI
jgi:hypothetical protein